MDTAEYSITRRLAADPKQVYRAWTTPAGFSRWFGPQQPDQEQAWAGIVGAVGLTEPVTEGDKVQFTVDGKDVIGVVDVVLEPGFLGVRTDDALLRFVGGGGMMLTGHHVFAGVDQDEAQATWTAWLADAYK